MGAESRFLSRERAMNQPVEVVDSVVLVGLCLLGLGFEMGLSHDSTTTTDS